jgi:hypothetical protein
MNVDKIFKAWLKTASHTKEEKELALERLSICNQCPSKVKGLGSLYICSECNCPIAFKDIPIGKTYTDKSQCPLHKWEN